jgi:hypothetical protein
MPPKSFVVGSLSARTDEPRDRNLERQSGAARMVQLHRLYASAGGVVTGDELAQLRESKTGRSISTIARWIVRREVVSFSWQSQILLPLFQFDSVDLERRPGLGSVLAELRDLYDDLEITEWFGQPSTWLDGEAPAAVIARDAAQVLDAARADRFAVRG